MENRKFMIDKIPAVLYGGNSENCFLYIHGKLGLKEEAEMFAKIAAAKGWQVLSIDLPGHGERKQETGKRQIQPMVCCAGIESGSGIYAAVF